MMYRGFWPGFEQNAYTHTVQLHFIPSVFMSFILYFPTLYTGSFWFMEFLFTDSRKKHFTACRTV